jgi:hypothetical protein
VMEQADGRVRSKRADRDRQAKEPPIVFVGNTIPDCQHRRLSSD